MPCNYNPYTGEVETLYERYEREYIESVMLQQAIDEKIEKSILRIKEAINYLEEDSNEIKS